MFFLRILITSPNEPMKHQVYLRQRLEMHMVLEAFKLKRQNPLMVLFE